MRYYHRDLERVLALAVKSFPAVVVTGPRQSGKTTLLRRFGTGTHTYVSMEDPDTRQRVAADPRAFLASVDGPAFLDEIQYVPEILPYIKTIIDDGREPGRWLLSGSQHFPLMKGVSESLAGRAAVLSLQPFGWSEFYGVGKYDPLHCPETMLRGFFPQMLAEKETPRQLWCGSYVQTYLERDVRAITTVSDLSAFERFLRLLTSRTGQLLNLAELGSQAGVTAPTAKRWLSVLQTSGQVYLLQPYHRNFGKRITKSPKVYVLDTGLSSYLFGLHDPEQLAQSPYWGNLFETLVVSEWVKGFYHRGLLPPLYFWRSSHGHEVDLLVDYQGKLHPFEIKATQTPSVGHAAGLTKWRGLAGKLTTPGAVLCNIGGTRSLAKDVSAVCWVRAISRWFGDTVD